MQRPSGILKYEGKLIQCRPYGSGHINDTFLLVYEIGEMGRLKVILQRMNTEVFYGARGADGRTSFMSPPI